MTRIEKSIIINCPPEKIWPMIQTERQPEWFDSFKKVEWTSKDEHKPGSTVHITAETAGVKAEIDSEITEVTENEKYAYRTTGGTMTGFGSWTLSPAKTGTKVTSVIDYELPYSVLGKLIDKLRVRKALEKDYDISLKKLKDMMEK